MKRWYTYVRRTYRDRQIKKLYKLAEKYNSYPISDEFMIYLYRTLRTANEKLGNT